MTHGIRDDNIQATKLLNRSLDDIEAVILDTGVLFPIHGHVSSLCLRVLRILCGIESHTP
jgi:hypothetical protein